MNQAVKVYLDQNILNDIAPKGSTSWTETKWGKRLIELSASGRIEVWASPANCLEIALNPDLDQRNQMALALNTLIRGQRMLPVYEVIVVKDFLEKIALTWPGATNLRIIAKKEKLSQQIYLALLGQLAALKDYDCSAGFGGIIRPKIITQIIQAEMFKNPKAELRIRLDQLQRGTLPLENPFLKYEQMSIEELRQIENEIFGKVYPVDKKAVEFLKKNKEAFITGYAREELAFATNQVFEYFDDAIFSINFTVIANNWNPANDSQIQPLHPQLLAEFQENPGRKVVYDLLKALELRFYIQIGMSMLYNRVIVNELEKALNKGKIPTGGLVLDGQHAVAALYADQFICRDTRLINTMKTVYHELENAGAPRKEVITDIGEFERKLNKVGK